MKQLTEIIDVVIDKCGNLTERGILSKMCGKIQQNLGYRMFLLLDIRARILAATAKQRDQQKFG